MNNLKKSYAGLILAIFISVPAFSQNPLIMDQFTADPTARVFEGKVYVYPSHDVNCGTDWFCMKDYHVFSSENLIDWTDHGKILDQKDVAWVNPEANSMWAPDAIEKDGKYYFYFPSIADTNSGYFGFRIGVAVSDTPYGPFEPEDKPIEGVSGIDPGLFIDHDGQAYISWSGRGNLYIAKLKDNMKELDSEPLIVENVPRTGLREGPFMFEREGIYYFTYPLVIEKTEALVYAMGDNPLGPFEYKGVFMDEHPSSCWTNHHSMVEYKGQWYLFYHHNDLSPDFDKNRSIRAEKISFNEDGTIRKVLPTHRGVGITPATHEIQIDRYSVISSTGAAISFNDPENTFDGWKTDLTGQNGWIRYNDVDFGEDALSNFTAKVHSPTGATLEVIMTNSRETKRFTVEVPAGDSWEMVETPVEDLPTGIQHVKVVLNSEGEAHIDWIQFN